MARVWVAPSQSLTVGEALRANLFPATGRPSAHERVAKGTKQLRKPKPSQICTDDLNGEQENRNGCRKKCFGRKLWVPTALVGSKVASHKETIPAESCALTSCQKDLGLMFFDVLMVAKKMQALATHCHTQATQLLINYLIYIYI
eukprot:scaffold70972_cov21-Tisochrysis_lutea.AAC.1